MTAMISNMIVKYADEDNTTPFIHGPTPAFARRENHEHLLQLTNETK